MKRTEFSIWLYIHINSAIEEFLESNKDEESYSNYRLNIVPDDTPGNIIPYDVSFLPNDQADYLFMPRLSNLLDVYVDEETGEIEHTSNVHTIAEFIDRWIGSGKWKEEPQF